MGQAVGVLEDTEVPTRNELESAAFGGLIAGVMSSIILIIGSETIQQVAGVFGFAETVGNGWITYIGLTVVLGLIFAGVVIQLIDRYVSFVVSLTSRYAMVRKSIMPLTNRFGMRVVVTSAMGVLYGLITGLVFLTVVIPLGATSATFPYFSGGGLLGFLAYGLILGITYGVRVVD